MRQNLRKGQRKFCRNWHQRKEKVRKGYKAKITEIASTHRKDERGPELKSWAILLYFYVVFATAELSSLSCKPKDDTVTCWYRRRKWMPKASLNPKKSLCERSNLFHLKVRQYSYASVADPKQYQRELVSNPYQFFQSSSSFFAVT